MSTDEPVLKHREGKNQAPMIKCPLVNFGRSVKSCMSKCKEADVNACQQIKKVPIEILDEINNQFLGDTAKEQWELRREFFLTSVEEKREQGTPYNANVHGGGGIVTQDDLEMVDDEPQEPEEDVEVEEAEEDDIPVGPYAEGEQEEELTEEKVEEEEEEEEEETEDIEEEDKPMAKKKSKKATKKTTKASGEKRGRKPNAKGLYVITCEGYALVVDDNPDPKQILEHSDELQSQVLAAMESRLEEVVALDGDDSEDASSIQESIDRLSAGPNTRIFKVAQELAPKVNVELVAQ